MVPSPPAPPREGRTVLITGCDTGIGRCAVRSLAADGFVVFAGVLTADGEASLRVEALPGVVPVRLDVTDPASIAAAHRVVVERVGQAGLDALVNNAGVGIGGPLEVVPLDWVREQYAINVLGPLAMVQTFLPLVRVRRGRVVNVTSIASHVAAPLQGPYVSSKFALRALTCVLRMELQGEGIRVIDVEPGPCTTPIWDRARRRADRLVAQLGPVHRERYLPMIEGAMHGLTKSQARGVAPERVAAAIHHAVAAARPRRRYRVGLFAHLIAAMARLLPGGAVEWILRGDKGLRDADGRVVPDPPAVAGRVPATVAP